MDLQSIVVDFNVDGDLPSDLLKQILEICHEGVDLFTAQKFRDNAEAPFLERGGYRLEIGHEYSFLAHVGK